jgi:protoporphyrinogen oxidase
MKVAVIGAGFSGMLAAYLLEKEGVEVTVYEKEESLGGHCKTLISKDIHVDLGTVFSFRDNIKELFVELQLDYSERFNYRNYIDDQFKTVQHLSAQDVQKLLTELEQLKVILDKYTNSLASTYYDHIPEELLMPLSDFLEHHHLNTVAQIFAPYLSSFGYGRLCETQAYYAFKAFNVETIYSFLRCEKLLFIDKGASELIRKLSHNISDIRYSIEVTNIEVIEDKVKVETHYDLGYYDKVLITTKLPRDVIKDDVYNNLMKQIDTNPFVTCAFEVEDENLVTTYYKANLGQLNKLQFYHPTKANGRTIIVAYAYGKVSKELITSITNDIKRTNIALDWHQTMVHLPSS